MNHPLLLQRIKALEEELSTLNKAKSITHPIYVLLNNQLTGIKTEYIQLHREELLEAKKPVNKDTLPFLSKAAQVLLTLRTALPKDGEANLIHAEEALAQAIQSVAEEVNQLFKK